MAKMIGNGTTMSLGTDGAVVGIQNLDMPNWAGDDVDVTDLATTAFMEFLYSGLADGGEASADVFIDPQGTMPTMGLLQTCTIVNTDGTNTRTITGSGYIREINMGNASPGEAIVGAIVFKYDGRGTPPSVTPGGGP